MIIADSCYTEMINSTARTIRARVELFEGSTLLDTYTYDGALKSFQVDRVCNSNRFFGFGICKKLTVNLLDKERKIHITKGQGLEVVVGVGCEYLYTCPIFYVDEVKRDENTNELTITAYDAIYYAGQHTVSEVIMPQSFTLMGYAAACASILNMPIKTENVNDDIFDLTYTSDIINFDGTESLRTALDAIAEVTQTIYFLNKDWDLVFKRLDIEGESVLTIDKSMYFTLDSETPRTLTALCHVTELGDNYTVSSGEEGITQYIRDNPFYTLRSDVPTLLNNALDIVDGLTIDQFDCKWRGNFLLEVGDKISLVGKDNEIITAYLLDDSISYNGGLIEKTKWNYSGSESETASNPTDLGQVLSQTFAKVDKVNKQIDLVVSETAENSSAISQLQLSTGDINASVSRIEENSNNLSDMVEGQIQALTEQVQAAITPEALKIEVSKILDDGIDKVTTSTGFTFDDEGLTISKSDSILSTQITEDGMTISRSDTEVLVVDNTGVQATNLHATTYLFIGKNSRFEDYDNDSRTGCFWIS